jgi:hypothetical protein
MCDTRDSTQRDGDAEGESEGEGERAGEREGERARQAETASESDPAPIRSGFLRRLVSNQYDICAYKRIWLAFDPLSTHSFDLRANASFTALVGQGGFHPGDQVMAISCNGYEVFYVYRPDSARDFQPLSWVRANS